MYLSGAIALGSTSMDYYVRNYYWGIPRDDTRLYLVDYSVISKPAACTCTRANGSYRKHTVFAPRNGAVVRARTLPEVDPADLPRKMTRNVQYFPELLTKKRQADAAAAAAAAANDVPPAASAPAPTLKV